MKTNLTKTHDIDSAYKEFDFTDIAKKYQDDGTKYCFDALEGRIVTGYILNWHVSDTYEIYKDKVTTTFHIPMKRLRRTNYCVLLGYAQTLTPVSLHS